VRAVAPLDGDHLRRVFSGIDAAMTAVALHVARLVTRESDRRHQFGYWHFEPLVLALSTAACSCVLRLRGSSTPLAA
jgi:predicted Co/Zn/Cd cation transporter (cation efflux family)